MNSTVFDTVFDTNDYIDKEKQILVVFLHPYENIVVDDRNWTYFVYVYDDADLSHEVDFEKLRDPSYVAKNQVFDESKKRLVDKWVIPIRKKASASK